jgi:alkylhydroperoxidase family enzyme
MTTFNVYTPATAPEASKGILKSWQEKLNGFLPNLFGVMAESPALLRGYSELRGAFEGGSFTPAERFVIDMTISGLNASPYSLSQHLSQAEKAGVPRDVVEALRAGKPLQDARLEALRGFVTLVMKKMGRADERDLGIFYKAGFSKAHVLEVILGVSVNTIGNYIDHIGTPVLDKTLEPFRVEIGTRPADRSHAA